VVSIIPVIQFGHTFFCIETWKVIVYRLAGGA